MNNALIDLERVSYQVGDSEILKDLSFSIRKGEVMSLVGTNGAGKSTLFGLLLGDFSPTTGSITYHPSQSAVLNGVGVVYDNQQLFPMLQVREMLSYFATIYGTDRNEYMRLSTIMGLDGILERQVCLLSQGERVKVNLCLALFHRPDFLVLDEPFANIDPTAVKRIWQCIQSTGATTLISAHDWQLAADVADRVCLLDEGRLLHQPLALSELRDLLPARRKIIVGNNPGLRAALGSEVASYEREHEMVILSEDPDVLRSVQAHTFNYSVLDTDLDDTYSYLRHRPLATPKTILA